MLPKMRTVKELVSLAKKEDPETKLTERSVRGFIKRGELPCVVVGNKYLISVEEFGKFLQGQTQQANNEVKSVSGRLHPVKP